jgi:hypothetical protein
MSSQPYGPAFDPRFTLHRLQPRADKLTAKQRRLCRADPSFQEALRGRVGSAERFAAFMGGQPFYLAVSSPCGRCGAFQRRTRDRSCYACHLNRGGENFERMKAGLRPIAKRSRDSHLDLLERKKSERAGDHLARDFGPLIARRWPTGRLEIVFSDGFVENDFAKLSDSDMIAALRMYPALVEALEWAGWTIPYLD